MFLRSALLLAFISASAARADFSFDSFDESALAELTLVGTAAPHGDRLRLTPTQEFQAGACWYTEKQLVAAGFDISFEFVVSGPFNGFGSADGMAFVVQNDSVVALGVDGGGQGYHGIPASLAIELQHFDGRQVSVQTNGRGPNDAFDNFSIAKANVNEINDGRVHQVQVLSEDDILYIRFDGRQIIEVEVEFADLLGLDDGKAWIGFTAGTGGAFANHDVVSWSFSGGHRRTFRRGDANADGVLNLGDPVFTLHSLFSTGSLTCDDAADSNDDGRLDISDAIGTLGYLFLGSIRPPPPFFECGLDPRSDDELNCESFPACS